MEINFLQKKGSVKARMLQGRPVKGIPCLSFMSVYSEVYGRVFIIHTLNIYSSHTQRLTLYDVFTSINPAFICASADYRLQCCLYSNVKFTAVASRTQKSRSCTRGAERRDPITCWMSPHGAKTPACLDVAGSGSWHCKGAWPAWGILLTHGIFMSLENEPSHKYPRYSWAPPHARDLMG